YTNNVVGFRTQSLLHSSGQPDFTANNHYDAWGRLDRMTDGTGTLIVQYTFDDAGNVTQEDHGNGTSTQYLFDANGRLASLINKAPGGAENSRFDYTYDELGRAQTVTTGGQTTTYGYDILNQLTSVALP